MEGPSVPKLRELKDVLFRAKIFCQSRINLVKLRKVTPGHLSYQCNICGTLCETRASNLDRETPSCTCCASNVRMRAIIHLLSVELFGKSLKLQDFPEKKEIKGIGMSDWDVYASGLQKKLGYTNTFYHKEPKLDITSIDPALEGTLDFIISTDVFEHILPPVTMGFKNMRRLLKPDGVLIFSVPYSNDRETIEHFPNLYKYDVIQVNGEYILKNITKDGKEETFKNLVFHGGPGTTLEFRLFAEAALVKEFEKSGFKSVRICSSPEFEHGIIWQDDWSLPIVARL